jgi:hypothetical protein
VTGIDYLKGRLGLISLKRICSERRLGKYISEVKLGDENRSEGWIHGRDSSAGIATSYRLDGPGSIFLYIQFFIHSVFLCITYFLTY